MNFANNDSDSLNNSSVIDDIIQLLHDYRWIYNFKVTNLLSDNILQNVPADWRTFLSNLSVESFNSIFIHQKSEESNEIPEDVRRFLELLNSTLISFESFLSSQPEEEEDQDQEDFRGVSLKKKHEIKKFADFIERKISRGKTVVDVGSGLGYLGEELCRRGFRVLGLEASLSNVAGAERRRSKISGHQFETRQLRVDSGQDCRDSLRSLAPDDSCLVGLHCCGDLTCDLLKIFSESEKCSSLMVVSCCYHKMRYKPSQALPVNFPLSTKVGSSIAKFPELHPKSSMQLDGFFNVFMLRVAAQQTIESWLGQSEAEHGEHMNNLGFRACLEKVVSNLNIKLTKKKRRSLPANVNENITSYTQAVLSRYDLESVDKEKLQTEMLNCYREHSLDFPLFELLTGLQFLVQAVIENLLTLDRLFYLQELCGSSESGICQIFEPTISPRNKVIYVTKM